MSTQLRPESVAMLQILALDPHAALKFSEYTSQWYIEARIETSDGVILAGLVEHRPDPSEAVEAFRDVMRDVDKDHVLASNAGHENRRHWRWNGAAFAEVPDFLLPWKLNPKVTR